MDIQSLIDDYANWLKSEIKVEKVGEYYELTTPYLDNANDYLQRFCFMKKVICFLLSLMLLLPIFALAETETEESQPNGSTEVQAPKTASSKNQQEEKE